MIYRRPAHLARAMWTRASVGSEVSIRTWGFDACWDQCTLSLSEEGQLVVPALELQKDCRPGHRPGEVSTGHVAIQEPPCSTGRRFDRYAAVCNPLLAGVDQARIGPHPGALLTPVRGRCHGSVVVEESSLELR